ncbi:MAG: phosphoribosylaminoimidazolesuccinocarboxamide synthase, partial [Fimbriimonas ginsengisoli]|nr:phosphoribosylaminoimidazolesuccinocarboxamide synthase [Fimbriimonas ginsengisoli]
QEGHDEILSFRQAVDIVGRETAEWAQHTTLTLYHSAARHAEQQGLILADTKFEFGETPDGLIWIDEALTPDSSRYWEPSLYEPGHAQPSYDKQFVRDYLETLAWDKRPPGPTLPPEIVARTLDKYLEAYARITGKSLALQAV